MSKLDHVDFAILKYLQENGRRPYTEIAKRENVSEGTVRTRIKRMVLDEVFEFKIHVNPLTLDLKVQAFIGLQTQLGKQDQISKTLLTYKEITYVGACLGEHELLIKAHFHSNQELGHFINNVLPSIEGILDVDVSVELKHYKESDQSIHTEIHVV